MYPSLKSRALYLGEAQFLAQVDWAVSVCQDLTKANKLLTELKELTQYTQDFSVEFLQKINDYATILDHEINMIILDIYEENSL